MAIYLLSGGGLFELFEHSDFVATVCVHFAYFIYILIYTIYAYLNQQKLHASPSLHTMVHLSAFSPMRGWTEIQWISIKREEKKTRCTFHHVNVCTWVSYAALNNNPNAANSNGIITVECYFFRSLSRYSLWFVLGKAQLSAHMRLAFIQTFLKCAKCVCCYLATENKLRN